MMAKKRKSISARTAEENTAISEKIQMLSMEGYPPDQATAIAMRMYRDNELVIKPIQFKYERVSERQRKKNLLADLKTAFDLLGLDNLYKDITK